MLNMFKYKSELIILILLIPILAYVGWQAYKSYFKAPDMEEFEKVATEEPVKPVAPPVAEQPPIPSAPKGTLDYKGFTKRDPLKASLPVEEKIEKPPVEGKPPEGIPEKEEPKKIIVLPTFAVTGVTWGQSPRAIIDNSVYKIGDIVKGAKILGITNQGIQMIYEGKEFFVTIQ